MTRLRIASLYMCIFWMFIKKAELMTIIPEEPFENPCRGSLSLRWIRDPSTCKRYIICAAGQPIRMPSCPDSHVWSVMGRNCVPKYSRWDDCSRVKATAMTRREAPQVIITQPQTLRDETEKKVVKVTKRHRPPQARTNHDRRLANIKRLFPNHPCAFPTTELLIAHAEKCHIFYNCSLPTNLPEWKYYEPLTQECVYPQVFSIAQRRCRNYNDVDCGYRKVSKNPCEYRENVCRSSHCRPCSVRFGNCEGREDGFHTFEGKEWTPDYIVCRDERSIQQLKCHDPRPIFSPETRTCEHLKNVPKKQGGLRPVCDGRPDGLYPDESGRCDVFFECSESRFKEYKKCSGGNLFSPSQALCMLGDVEPPCGNVTNSICQELPDGYYADPYGRCPLYIHCIDRRLLGYLKCPFGSYNPYTERCETSDSAPKPCGNLENPCLYRADGEYADLSSNCVSSFTCRKQFLIKVTNCPPGQVFNELTSSCGDVNATPSPCGLAPSCGGKQDGNYPSNLKGCQHYYECERERFVKYDKCGWEKGGFYFNSKTRKCDYPLNICGLCGTKQDNCTTSATS